MGASIVSALYPRHLERKVLKSGLWGNAFGEGVLVLKFSLHVFACGAMVATQLSWLRVKA